MPGANLFATGYFYAYFQAATARVRIVAERQDAGLLVACAFLTWRQPMLRKFKELPNIAREVFYILLSSSMRSNNNIIIP